jgi:hypothetical protein
MLKSKLLLSTPKMLRNEHGSTYFNLGSYGFLHCGPLPDQSLTMLRAHSSSTPPDACAHVNDVFDPRTLETLCQAHTDERPLHCVKLVDGFVIVTPSNKIVCVISDHDMCVPQQRAPAVHVTAPHHDKPNLFLSHVQPPKAPPINAMYLVNHSNLTGPNEVSRFAPVNCFAAKFTAHIPLDPVPRVMMAAKPMGKAEGRILVGEEADFIKQVCLHAASQGYHKPMTISDTVGRMLMINNNAKPILCSRIKDGILGYRARNDGANSLVFAAHSVDMNHDEPIPGCPVKVVKATYNNDAITAPRIFVSGGEGDGGDITPDMTFAQVLDIMSHKFNGANIEAMGCKDYEKLCKLSSQGVRNVWSNCAAINIGNKIVAGY